VSELLTRPCHAQGECPRCYTGLETRDEELWLHPALPPELGRVRFQMTYRRHGIAVDLTPTTLALQLRSRAAAPVQVRVE
jgi:trehalose/maltose hydrolase-like predicted phosphorylase